MDVKAMLGATAVGFIPLTIFFLAITCARLDARQPVKVSATVLGLSWATTVLLAALHYGWPS